MSLISEIHSPEDVKKIDPSMLPQLCAEIRSLIIDVVSKNGGHLAPNLGVVELTIALHRVFSVPRDKIVWDVGHQSYIHKILTGRLKDFPSLRTYGGLCGFPNAARILVTRLERDMPARLFQPLLVWPVPVTCQVMITMSLLSSGMGP